MNGTEVRTNERTYERKDENYIPLGINAGGIIKDAAGMTIDVDHAQTAVLGAVWSEFALKESDLCAVAVETYLSWHMALRWVEVYHNTIHNAVLVLSTFWIILLCPFAVNMKSRVATFSQ